MSEPKGPFEASLDTLRRKWSLIRGSRWAKKDYRDAIRVLVAAGKVDGKQLCEYQRGIVNMLNEERVAIGGIPLGETSADQQILALLEALPSKEERR